MTVRKMFVTPTIAAAVLLASAALLLGAWAEEARGAFPGKNGRIAFSGFLDDNRDIYTVRPDGTDFRRVTNAAGDDSTPEWSPDGTKIAFTSSRDGNYDIYVKDLASGQVTQLTDSDIFNTHPAYSPDGSQIAFASLRDNHCYDLWVMNADGSNQRQLTDDCLNDLAPEWSPDGSKIVFMKGTDTVSGIYVMDAEGSEATNLTNPPVGFAPPVHSLPDWSPNGARIAWARSEDPDSAADIWKMAADGSRKDRLTFSPVGESDPSWSPNGGKIVFTREDTLFKMNKDGTNKTAITDPRDFPVSYADYPDWQPKPAP